MLIQKKKNVDNEFESLPLGVKRNEFLFHPKPLFCILTHTDNEKN